MSEENGKWAERQAQWTAAELDRTPRITKWREFRPKIHFFRRYAAFAFLVFPFPPLSAQYQRFGVFETPGNWPGWGIWGEENGKWEDRRKRPPWNPAGPHGT